MAASSLAVGLKSVGRRALAWPGLRQLGTGAYRALTRRAADELMRVEGMRAVLLTGSLNRGGFLPGVSDVDLMLVADLPTLEAELSFRRELSAFQHRHTRQLVLFPHLDYVEHRDLALMFRLGDAWVRDPTVRWEVLAANAPVAPPDPAGLEDWEYLMLSLRRWASHCHLLLVEPNRIDARNLRHAWRFFAATVSTWLGRGIRLDPEVALEQVRPHVDPDSPLGRLSRDPAAAMRRRDVGAYDDITVGGMEALEHHARKVGDTFSELWPAARAAPQVAWTPPTALGQALDQGLVAGAALVLPVPGARRHQLLIVTPEGLSVERALRRGLGLTARMRPSPAAAGDARPDPVLLTAAMSRVLALLEPAPLLAASLAAGASWQGGQLPAPPAPSARILRRVVEIGLVKTLWRPRGRTFRIDRPASYGRRKMANELLGLYPALQALDSGRPVDFSLSHTDQVDEVELLRLYRAQLEEVRSLLADRPPPPVRPHA